MAVWRRALQSVATRAAARAAGARAPVLARHFMSAVNKTSSVEAALAPVVAPAATQLLPKAAAVRGYAEEAAAAAVSDGRITQVRPTAREFEVT